MPLRCTNIGINILKIFLHSKKIKNKEKYFGNKNNIHIFATLSLCTGIVRIIMKLKKNEQLQYLAQRANKEIAIVEEQIVCALIQQRMVEDCPDNYGESVYDCLSRVVLKSEIINILKTVGILNVNEDDIYAFFDLVLFGHGDCPICGGEMEITDGDYKNIGGDGYLSAFEYATLWEEKTCKNCGFIK